ncbi:MAG: DUF4258 domain-containing protein [bacterium]
MSETFGIIAKLVGLNQVMISDHGYEAIVADNISVREIVSGITEGAVVEDYPDFQKGRCVPVLQKHSAGKPIHVVWGIPKGASSPAILVTAYRPDPKKWSKDYMRRQK